MPFIYVPSRALAAWLYGSLAGSTVVAIVGTFCFNSLVAALILWLSRVRT